MKLKLFLSFFLFFITRRNKDNGIRFEYNTTDFGCYRMNEKVENYLMVSGSKVSRSIISAICLIRLEHECTDTRAGTQMTLSREFK